MSLRSVNLNLIPILQALLHERGVTKAARSLGVTQPTVSMALAKLRTILRDPLLVQVDRQWRLTSRAIELIGPVDEVCQALDAICNPGPYDPAAAKGTVTFALPDSVAMIAAPPLMRALRAEAPGLELHFIDVWREFRVRQRSDEIDLLITLQSIVDHPELGELRSAPLWRDRMVTITGLKAADPVPDMGSAVYFPGLGPPSSEVADFLDSYMSKDPVTGKFQYFSVLALIAAEENLAAKIPASLAHKLQAYLPIRILDGEDSGPVMDVCLAWNPAFDADPAHRWLRNLVIRTLRRP